MGLLIVNQAAKGDKKVQERTTLVGFGIGNGIRPIGRLETSKWGLFVRFGIFFLSDKKGPKVRRTSEGPGSTLVTTTNPNFVTSCLSSLP